MTLDSVVSPEVLNKYLILVVWKAGDEATNRKSRSHQKRESWHLSMSVLQVASTKPFKFFFEKKNSNYVTVKLVCKLNVNSLYGATTDSK